MVEEQPSEPVEDEEDDEPQGSYLEWTATLIRILALWMGSYAAVSATIALANLSTIINSTHGPLEGSMTWVIYQQTVGTLSEVAVATILWWNARRLAAAIWRGRTADEVPPVVEPPVFQRAILQGFGVYVAATAVAALPPAVVDYLRERIAASVSVHPSYLWARLLGVVLQLLIGLWLFLGTATLARWFAKAREAPSSLRRP